MLDFHTPFFLVLRSGPINCSHHNADRKPMFYREHHTAYKKISSITMRKKKIKNRNQSIHPTRRKKILTIHQLGNYKICPYTEGRS